jgi:phosphohistidine phosphatase
MATSKARGGSAASRKPARPASRRAAVPKQTTQETDRFIVLLRHGIAEDRTEEMTDEERALTPEGHAQMKYVGRGLEKALPKVQAIYSSPLVRATQTALWVSKAYRSRVTLNAVDALAPYKSEREIFELLASFPERRVILIGHEPTLTAVFREILRLDESHVLRLEPGGCYCLRIAPDGTAAVEWVLPPRILRKLGE